MLGVLTGLLPRAPVVDGAAALVVIGADVGLCGDYVARLALEAAAARAALGPGPIWCIGQRAVRPLGRVGCPPDRVWPGAGGTSTLPRLLVPLVNEIVAETGAGRIARLVIVAARFEGAGRFQPRRIAVLPVQPRADAASLRGSPYARPEHLAAVVVREFLYVALHETLLDALAAEHGKRLVVAESARAWLEERTHGATQELRAVRRETATQEVLEVSAGARVLRRGVGGEG